MAENDINNIITAAKRKRGANWSAEEEIILIEEVIKYEPRLFGKIKGAGMKGKHCKLKEETWKAITDTLNSQFRNERSSDSNAKKYDNIKQRAKDKIDNIRRPKTGGGPAPAPMTPAEEALYQAMDTRPNIVGLIGGIDSDELTDQTSSLTDSMPVDTCTDASGDVSSSINEKRSTEKKRKKTTSRETMEELEIKNLHLENEKLVEENKKLSMEQKKLETEEKKMQTEIDYIELKKSYLLCKLNSEFPECLQTACDAGSLLLSQ